MPGDLHREGQVITSLEGLSQGRQLEGDYLNARKSRK